MESIKPKFQKWMPLFTTKYADDTDSTETRWVPSYILLHLLKSIIEYLCVAKWNGGKGAIVRCSLFVCTFRLSVFGRWQHRVDCTTPSTAVIGIDQKSNVFISVEGKTTMSHRLSFPHAPSPSLCRTMCIEWFLFSFSTVPRVTRVDSMQFE